MTDSNVDYTTYFATKTLPRIHGEPDYPQLKILKDHLKANASRVTSELGGGGHGHLGLILTPAEYATVSGTPYIRPHHPGALIIPPGTTQHASQVLRDTHKKQVTLFHQTIDLDNALKKQITDALDKEYYDDLLDRTTNTILQPIPDILDFLFTNFGEVESGTLIAEHGRVREMKFTIQDQLPTLYTAIEDLAELGRAARNPFTPEQLVDIALTVLKNTGDFQQAILEWYQLPLVDQTYPRLKTHFNRHRRLLKKSRGASMQAAGFHSANQISK